MQLQILNPLNQTDWNAKLAFPSAESFFNTREWAQVLTETYGFRPQYLAQTEGNEVVALLPMMEVDSWMTGRRGVGLPFSDACEPLGVMSAGPESFLKALMDLGQRRKWRYVEIRNRRDFSGDIPSSSCYLQHVLDLSPGETGLWNNLAGGVRTAIRKSIRSGLEITFSTGMDAVAEFYRLNCLTRRRHGLPPQPYRFFRALHQHVLSRDLGVVAMACHKGVCVSAAVFCHRDKYALFKYGASDKYFQNLRGNSLIMWEAIRRYAQQGYGQLSFGRTACANEGLRRFKLGWGTSESVLRYIRFDFRMKKFVGERKRDPENGYSCFRFMPPAVSRLAGALLYGHMA